MRAATRLRALASAAALASLSFSSPGSLAAQSPRPEVLPADIGWDHGLLDRNREPSLWSAGALARHRSRLRLSAYGIFCLRVVIRIDETTSGSFLGTYKAERGCRGAALETEILHFNVSKRDMAGLHDLLHKNDILQQPRQGWDMDEDMCLDGEEILIELVDQGGYRATGANVPCTAPQEFREVARRIIDLAGADEARKFVD